MKVLHVPFGFYPDPPGGTEVYVAGLAAELQARGVDVVVAAPGRCEQAYTHAGLAVRRFALAADVRDPRELYGEGDPRAAASFARFLDQERPDIVHLHAFTRGVSLRVARAARRFGSRVVFTYHTPSVSCQRGSLVRWGVEACHGLLDTRSCAGCSLHGLGLSAPASALLGNLPPVVGRALGSVGLAGGAWTALRMPDLVQTRHDAVRRLLSEVDHIVAVCGWVRDLLLRNGVPGGRISVSRHGLTGVHPPVRQRPTTGQPPRIAYLGRLDPLKGPDVLVRAVRQLPDTNLRLDLYAVGQDAAGEQYAARLRALAAGDTRIAFRSAIANEQVVSTLAGYDLLAVPSQGLETGPLVVLEAFAAGVPVVGSQLGGIRETVTHDLDGWLVEDSSPTAWAQALRELLEHPDQLARLRAGVRPPRRMREVADDMLAVYAALGGQV